MRSTSRCRPRETRRIPIVMLIEMRVGELAEIEWAGADACLVKPCDGEELLDLVKTLLQREAKTE